MHTGKTLLLFTAAQDLRRCRLYSAARCGKLRMEEGARMLNLFVVNAGSGEKIPTVVREASEQDLAATRDWQTNWETPFAVELPN